MLIVQVQIEVRPEAVEAFKAATLANARESIKEPGIARFDFLQSEENPARFLLVEAYRTAEAPQQHKQTAHYAIWRDAVASMMAHPRASLKYHNLHPDDRSYGIAVQPA